MRVLHVISDANIGGAGVLLLSLLRNFDRVQVECTVALPKESALIGRIQTLGIPIHPLRHSPDRISTASIAELKHLLSVIKPDIVHTNAAVSARICAKLCRVTVIHTRHCCFPPSGIWK